MSDLAMVHKGAILLFVKGSVRCEGVCLTILAFCIGQDMGRYCEVVPVSDCVLC